VCDICLDYDRDDSTLCIVQSAKDIFIMEDSKQFNGKYFSLESLDILELEKLINLVEDKKISNILFAITPSLANDAFILYIEDKLDKFDINFTKIAQGIPTGVSLENVDTLSLSKAILGRTKI
jgi:recombination protein RecR